MRNASTRAWRGALLVLPTCLAAWAAGCTDEDPAATPPGVDAGEAAPPDAPPTPVPDAGIDAAPPRDCAADLGADGIWKHLDCSGLYTSFGAKTVAADARPYKPAHEFWSDGADKLRWIFLPVGSKIDISDFDEWNFPVGTKTWKEFKVGGKRIETRLYMKLPDKSWVHTSYRWNADESDAVRKDSGEKIAGIGPDAGIYEVPNTGQCDTCHTGRKDQLLGFDAVSLGLAGATGQTLATLATEGWLSAAPPKTSLELPSNGDPQTSSPAIGWIHANCGACHNGNTNAAATFRAHFLVRATDLAPTEGGAAKTLQELDVWTQGYCTNTIRTDPDTALPYAYIRGGNAPKSLMSILSGRRAGVGEEPSAGLQMPPLVTRAVDVAGHKLLDDWITTLTPCP